MAKGTLKRWNDDRGFGFLRSDDSQEDIFIHISELKGMSRRPVVGDVIFYQLVVGNDGKSKATNATINGVSSVKRSKPDGDSGLNKVFGFVVSLALLIGIGFFAYEKFLLNRYFPGDTPPKIVSEANPFESSSTTTVESENLYHCDGRQHCSEMTSKAEADYFVKHCPNTKMDGDHDGDACESDSRF